jgi:hypothetical protein
MSAASLFPPSTAPERAAASCLRDARDSGRLRLGAGITLLVGSLLLLRGKRRAGLVVAATGAALTMLDEQDTIREWWDAIPGYLDGAQRVLDNVNNTVEVLIDKRNQIMAILGK